MEIGNTVEDQQIQDSTGQCTQHVYCNQFVVAEVFNEQLAEPVKRQHVEQDVKDTRPIMGKSIGDKRPRAFDEINCQRWDSKHIVYVTKDRLGFGHCRQNKRDHQKQINDHVDHDQLNVGVVGPVECVFKFLEHDTTLTVTGHLVFANTG